MSSTQEQINNLRKAHEEARSIRRRLRSEKDRVTKRLDKLLSENKISPEQHKTLLQMQDAGITFTELRPRHPSAPIYQQQQAAFSSSSSSPPSSPSASCAFSADAPSPMSFSQSCSARFSIL